MTYNKWPSPHGHAISSRETDQLTKQPENVTCADLSNAALLAEAVKVIEKAKNALFPQAIAGKQKQLDALCDCKHFLAKLGR